MTHPLRRAGPLLCGALASALALAAAPPALARPAPAEASKAPVKLVYGGDSHFPPFEYLDAEGRPRGFNVELLELLASEAGFEIEFRLEPWRGVLLGLEQGRIDLASLADSAERRLRYDFLAQTWTMHQSVLFRPGRSEYPRSLRELGRETVALLENGVTHETLRALPPEDRPAFRLASDQNQAMQMLVAGEVTAVAGNGLTLRHIAASLGLPDMVEVEVRSSGYYLATQTGRGQELSPLAEAYERLRTTGRLTSVIEKSLVLPTPALSLTEQLRRVAGLVSGLLVVAGLALVWSTQLRRQVLQRTAQLSQSLQDKARLADALADGEKRFRGILEDVHLGVLLYSCEGRIVFANPSAQELLGLPAEELLGRGSLSCAGQVLRDDGAPLPEDQEPALRCLALARPVHRIHLALEKPGSGKSWFLVHADPLMGPSGEVREVICTFADVTEERRLREERERFFEIAPTLHLVVGRDRRIRHANPAASRMLGLEPASLLGKLVYSLVHPDDIGRVKAAILSLDHGVSDVELRCRHADGSWRWVLWNAVADRDQDLVYTVGLDVTERRQAERQVHHLAYHDALTGLPNRQLFLDRLRMALAHAQRRHESLAVFFVDLDHFKVINDSLGHTVGDKLLVEVGARLSRSLREEDTVARLGGDEFTVIVPGVSDADLLSRMARKLQRAVKEPLFIDGRELTISASLGIGLYPEDGDSPEALLQNADVAMYRAKELGRDTFQFHTPALSARVREHLDVEGRLRRALATDELRVHYQPIFSLSTGRIEAYEALVRWEDRGRGLVLPAEFIPVAEVTGLIVSIGSFVLNQACQDARLLGSARINVNLSARQLQAGDLLQEVQDTLLATGLPADRLELEMTESAALQDQERTAGILRGLRALGVRVVMDDFGTGYSSLGYLRRFPLDGVKIDRSFVADLGIDDGAAGIVAAVCAMARQLGLRVVAEGVEREEQLDHLRSCGCGFAQGFLLGRPVPVSECDPEARLSPA